MSAAEQCVAALVQCMQPLVERCADEFTQERKRLDAAFELALRGARKRDAVIEVFEEKVRQISGLEFRFGCALYGVVWSEVYGRLENSPFVRLERELRAGAFAKQSKEAGAA